ncbi:MAG TPA: hypothetical protein VHU84_15460 [Lacipirellulaceae bacterium]|nr:hypothetical protein [Lacipirellulaceae bacterium]
MSILVCGSQSHSAVDAKPPSVGSLKSESFDHDPGWEAINNRVVPKRMPTVRQDFGYRTTNIDGKSVGEIGGTVQRSTTPASYAAEIPARSLDDRLTASGTFSIEHVQSGAGLFFGFFNSDQSGGTGRPVGSLGFDFDFEASGGRLAARLISADNQSCGTFLTPFIPGKFRPTPLKADGTLYHFTIDYNPQAAAGNGQFTITLTSDTHKSQDYGQLSDAAKKEAQARFPLTTAFNVDVPAKLHQAGTKFDRFGLHNAMKAGGAAQIFFRDLKVDGRNIDLDHDPDWTGVGNHTTFEDRELTGAHNFGYSDTNFAGGQTGEVGGSFWRGGDFAYYADRVGPLNLRQKLVAHGKVKLIAAGPDSDMSFGWFNSASRSKEAADTQNFVGIHVGGPTRIGHYLSPVLASSDGTVAKLKTAPVIKQGVTYDWSLIYDPDANSGRGSLQATLGTESGTLPLRPNQRTENAHLDRFGFFTSTTGGQMVKIYFDDLQYTATVPK